MVALFFLTKSGCNSNKSEIASQTEQVVAPHDHDDVGGWSFGEDIEFPESEYDSEIDAALEAFNKSQQATGKPMGMPQGIMELLAVSRKDTNNIRANYYLALFAIESGQLEKAEKRFEKLILLQPEIQEYEKRLADVRKQLGK